MIYLTDMSVGVASSSCSTQAKDDCWWLIPYETTDPNVASGTMIGAASFIDVPEARLPLGVSGWHSIYVGYWNPFNDYDGATSVKVKLSDDPAFFRIADNDPAFDTAATYLKEFFFKNADLTGRDLIFGKIDGLFAQKTYIAYVKLVPLSPSEVAAIEADRGSREKKVLQSSIDGTSYFFSNEFNTEAHLMELVERYRDADVNKVIWAFSYGNFTNYPSKVCPGYHPTPMPKGIVAQNPSENPSIAFEKACVDGLDSFFARGIVPQRVVADHAHKMGLKFDASFRFACGGVPPSRWPEDEFIKSHPEYRQVLQDGTVIEKGSFAFPEVRDQMLSIIREVAEDYDIDGVQMFYVRGFHFLQYEKPVLDAYRAEYGEDGTKVGYDDPKMQKVRAKFMTQFMRDVRRVLDEAGAKKGRRLELGAWVSTTHIPYIMDGGLDVLTWLREKLMDSITPYSDLRLPGDIFLDGNNRELLDTAKANGCEYVRAYNCDFKSKTVESMFLLAKACLAGYDQGVEKFAIWDMDLTQDMMYGNYHWWQLAGRLGHRDEVESFVRKTITTGKAPMEIDRIRLKSISGHDMLGGMFDVLYSGG